MIPVGRYSAKCVDYTFLNKGNGQQIEIRLEVVDGPSKGEQVSYYGGFSGRGEAFTFEAMRACGWDDLQPLANLKRNTVEIDVGEREYNGKVYPQVRIYAKRSGCQTKPEDRMSEKEADEFLRRILGAPEPAPKRERGPREPGLDDDLGNW